MANNKVQLADGTVLLDLTGDTVDAAHLMQGYTAHDKSGAAIVGTATGGDEVDMYVGTVTPTSAETNDLWMDLSNDIPDYGLSVVGGKLCMTYEVI